MPSLSNRQGPAMWLPKGPRHAFVETAEFKPIRYLISDQTVDSALVPVPFAKVEVFETIPGTRERFGEPKARFVNSTVSDANGNYSVEVHAGAGATFRCVGYKDGAPDIFGTTDDGLTPTAS